jgi:hypothetical protein
MNKLSTRQEICLADAEKEFLGVTLGSWYHHATIKSLLRNKFIRRVGFLAFPGHSQPDYLYEITPAGRGALGTNEKEKS